MPGGASRRTGRRSAIPGPSCGRVGLLVILGCGRPELLGVPVTFSASRVRCARLWRPCDSGRLPGKAAGRTSGASLRRSFWKALWEALGGGCSATCCGLLWEAPGELWRVLVDRELPIPSPFSASIRPAETTVCNDDGRPTTESRFRARAASKLLAFDRQSGALRTCESPDQSNDRGFLKNRNR